MTADVYTIGYAGRSLDQFVSLLRDNSITAVADVRSRPFTKLNPEFNSDSLRASLKQTGIVYVFLGNELGARTTDENCYISGRVQYERLASTPTFQFGLERIEKGSREHRVALMCAERDPLNCHRCILVSRHLEHRGVPVYHILDDGKLEPHKATIDRLLRLLGIPEEWRTPDNEDRYQLAYRIQGDRIAFQKDKDDPLQYEFWK